MSYIQPHNALGRLSLQGRELYGEDDLVASLRLQIKQTPTIESFSTAIDIIQDALLAVPHTADERSVDRLTEGLYVYRLGSYFYRRSLQTSSAEDLDTGIRHMQQSIALTEKVIYHPKLRIWLIALAHALGTRYERRGDMKDCNEGIEFIERSIFINNGEDDEHLFKARGMLAIAHQNRYQLTGCTADLTQALNYLHLALENPCGLNTDIAAVYLRLGGVYIQMVDCDGDPSVLNLSLENHIQGIQLISMDDPQRPIALHGLADCYQRRYQFLDNKEDLFEADAILEEIHNSKSPKHPHPLGYVLVYANVKLKIFQNSGNLSVLDEATSLLQNAISEDQGLHEAIFSEAKILLLNILLERYWFIKTLADLEAALKIARQTIADLPISYTRRDRILYSLSLLLKFRFYRLQQLIDYNESVEILYGLIDKTARDPLEKMRNIQYRRQLAHSMSMNCVILYDNGSLFEDSIHPEMMEAIEIMKEVIADTPETNSIWKFINHLTLVGLYQKMIYFSREMYLDEAIVELKRAELCVPNDDQCVALVHENFRAIYEDRYAAWEQESDLNMFISSGQQAVTYETNLHSKYRVYVRMSQLLITHGRLEEGFQCLESAIGLMPFLVRSSGTRDDHEYRLITAKGEGMTLARCTPDGNSDESLEVWLSPALGICELALSLGLELGKPVDSLLSLVECGRGIIATNILPYQEALVSGDLHSDCPELFEEFVKRRKAATDATSSGTELDDSGVLARVAKNNAVRDLDEILQTIRALDGYERFLLPPESAAEYSQLSKDCGGPLVFLSASERSAHAIIITGGGIQALDLPALALQEAVERVELLKKKVLKGSLRTLFSRSKKLQEILCWLWKTTVRPVLEGLGFLKEADRGESLPRIWWIPGGIMANFPIHVACERSDHGVFTYVVSSYGTTLKTLSLSQKRNHAKEINRQEVERDFYLLAGMMKTPGLSDLPQVGAELDSIERSIANVAESVRVDCPTKDTIIDLLPVCSHAHFACHGISDSESPSNSGILLQHGTDLEESDRLTVKDISEIDAEAGRWESVFLSVCSSANVAAEELIEEGMHLASEFQMLGFCNVIATLWPVNDDVSKEVAVRFYEALAKRYGDSGGNRVPKGCYAEVLQNVMAEIRRDSLGNVLQWAPFVHFGV